jgi:excisionase family DNA binding protein
MTDELLTVDDVAQIWGVSPWTVRHWVSEGKIKYVKKGNLVRFEPLEVQRDIRSCRRNGNENGKSHEDK